MNKTYLNVGCGSVKLAGFINTDLLPEADLQLDVRNGLPFENNSVHGIYCEHFIEHLGQGDATAFLRECRRVLVADGILRVSTPDLDVVIDEFQSGNWRQPWMDKYRFEWIVNRAESLNIQMREWGHQWLFNEEELARLGEFSGFSEWQRAELNHSQDPMLANRETRSESTLIIEFKKSAATLSDHPLVSIVMPVYKVQFFAEALDSAIAQTYVNLEIIVLDDSSDAQIESLVQSKASSKPIRYFRNNPRLGEIASLTRGIGEARGELIKPLYDDDLLEPDCVARLAAAMLDSPDASLATSRRRLIDALGNDLGDAAFSMPLVGVDSEIDGVSLAQEVLNTGMNRIGEPSTVMIRRSQALAIHPVVMSFSGIAIEGAGDVALYLNLLSRGNALYLTDRLSRFRMHAEQSQHAPAVHERGVASWAFLRKHAQRLGLYSPGKSVQLISRALSQSCWSSARDAVPALQDVGAVARRPRILVYSSEAESGASAQLRLLQPFRHLAADFEIVWGSKPKPGREGYNCDLALLPTADLIVIQRYFALERNDVDRILNCGRPVVFEMDDLLLDVPQGSPYFAAVDANRAHLHALIERCEAIVVSTPALSEAVHAIAESRQIYVLPNSIEPALFHGAPAIRNGPIRIALTGMLLHQNDYAIVEKALDKVLSKYYRRVLLVFMGITPEHWRNHHAVTALDFVEDYQTYANALPRFEFDIALVPLEDTRINRCKSDVRWLEYSAAGIAGIYSDLEPYAAVRHGETGLKVANTTESWFDAICDLIDRPDKRLAIARAAQAEVLEKRAVEVGAKVYARTYGEILAAHPVANRTELPTHDEEAEKAPQDFYGLWQLGHSYLKRDALWIAERMDALAFNPVYHLAVIVPEGGEDRLANNIKALGHQFYPHWKLTIVSSKPVHAALAGNDKIAWIQGSVDRHLVLVNQALLDMPADWVGMWEAGDKLAPHALFSFADKADRHPELQALYSDEDRVDAEDAHSTPFFKTDFNLEMLRAAPFVVGGLMLLRRELFAELNGFDLEMEGVEAFDLTLRAWEKVGHAGIGHVADVLYHRHTEGGHGRLGAEEIAGAHRRALEHHLARMGCAASLDEGLLPGTFHVRYPVRGNPLISILIPTKNEMEMLKRCLTSLIEGTGYANCEILVLDNGSDEPEAIAYLSELKALNSPRLKVLDMSGPFNFSAITNGGAKAAQGDYFLLLNNDTAVLHEEWLEEMLGLAQLPDVGVVGAKLFHSDGTIQHAGVIMGLGDAPAEHPFICFDGKDDGYFGRLKLPQEFSTVTAACMLVRRTVYEEVNGLDEVHLQVAYNDIDFCLRVREKGYRVLFTPHARLLHEGSASQKKGVEPLSLISKRARLWNEVAHMFLKWRHVVAFDPAYNRNLSAHSRDFSIETMPCLTWDPEWRPRPRVLAHPADRFGCGEYRVIAPMRALNEAGRIMGWETGNYLSVPEMFRMEPECIVLQRQVDLHQLELIAFYKRFSNAFRIYEIDDLITNIPIKSIRKKQFVEQKDLHKRFRKGIAMCDRFIVSTDYLAEQYKGYIDDIVVVPNYIERARWGELKPTHRQEPKPRVGWAGSVTHDGDLAEIFDVVKATAKEVDWVFLGMCPDEIRPYVAEFHKGVNLEDYPTKLASLDLDLAVAPLEDVPFNHGKSHLRLLEYGVLGYPVICTDITPYRGDYPVTRVANRFKDWVDSIRSHVADRDELARRGNILRDYINANWILEDNLDVWAKAWLP